MAQIKEHKWMAPYVPVQRPVLHQQPLSVEGDAGVGEYSEQVLRLMHSLGIDQHKTVEVRVKRSCSQGDARIQRGAAGAWIRWSRVGATGVAKVMSC